MVKSTLVRAVLSVLVSVTLLFAGTTSVSAAESAKLYKYVKCQDGFAGCGAALIDATWQAQPGNVVFQTFLVPSYQDKVTGVWYIYTLGGKDS